MKPVDVGGPGGERLAFLPGITQRARMLTVALIAAAASALVVVNAGGFSYVKPVAWRFGGVLGLNALALADHAQTLANVELVERRKDNQSVLLAARRAAIAALRRDPLLPQAWRALAIVEKSVPGGSPDRAFALLLASSFTSRRDTGTSALLLQEFVKRGDVAQGFRQLDLALRRSPQAREALLPVLVQGLADRQLRHRLVEALKRDVSWRDDLLRQLTLAPPADDAVVAFIKDMPTRLIKEEREALELLAAGLVQSGRLSAARALGRRLLPAQTLVMNGGFEKPNAAPPLNWALQATADYDAIQAKFGGQIAGAQALYVRSKQQEPTEVARQIIFLLPGDFELSALSGTQSGDRAAQVSILVSCVGPRNSVGIRLASLQFPPTGARYASGTRLSVPRSGCPAQWLLVMVGGGTTSREAASWIDNVAVRARVGQWARTVSAPK